MPEALILKVAVPSPLHRIFDYLPPEGCERSRLLPGMRVQVPFGRSERCGVLVDLAAETELQQTRLKRAVGLPDKGPLFSSDDLSLLKWAAEYYQHPLGEVIANALPVRLRRGKSMHEPVSAGWRLTSLGKSQQPDELARAPRQAALIRLLAGEPDGLSREEIFRCCGECRPIIRRLQQKGWLEPCEIEPPGIGSRGETAAGRKKGSGDTTGAAPTLNPAQQAALEKVTGRLSGYGAYLLDGVTGSGKTEVYLGLMEWIIRLGRQVLLLVPEIGLTPQLLARVRRRLPVPTALLHSGLSETERERAWLSARSGVARILIGTRSAVFTPLPELGLILVDEEHDLSFKQQDGFRYSARDISVIRAQRAGCTVVMGSATPSMESLKNAREGRYGYLSLPTRAGVAAAPRLDLLDIRSVRLESGVSPTLIRMADQEMQAGNQVLLFLNRRGYAPILTCHDCGWLAECRRCDARMTFHQSAAQLWCHHCGYRHPVSRVCPECGGEALRTLGQGTERLYEMLGQRFPDRRIVRIDRDSTRSKGSLARLLGEIKKGEYSLLLGTQMLAKGHHFPDVTLVGILEVDQGLFGADFRASERMAQLVVQVAGRAGRAEKPGRVVIQTRHPDHPLLQTLLRRGYQQFAADSMSERQAAGLPPYSYQALLRAEAHREADPVDFLEQASALLGELGASGIELWGPVPAPMERRAGRYRAHLLVQSGSRPALQALLSRWMPGVRSLKAARKVRWSIDVDPQEML